MSERPKDNPETAAELLAGWRAASRDTAAAEAAAKVASLALQAAKAADDAATETETAATAASTAVEQALRAAASAKRAAAAAAKAAHILSASAEGDQVRADLDVEMAKGVEENAAREFHDADAKGFPRTDDG